MQTTYLDYAATTPVHPRVLEAMQPYFTETFGNPSSIHRFGQRAESALESAREKVAAVLKCLPEEIVFTSGGSEANNLAIRGGGLAARRRGTDGLAASRAEHDSVSRTVDQLERESGFRVAWLPVDSAGMVTPEAVQELIDSDTALVSVMYANNEIGTINPIAEIAAICRKRGALLHSDAVQAAAYLDLDVRNLGVDLLALGGHKFYGPKGVGALYVRHGTQLVPQQTGGGQEFGLRAGTPNIPYIVGFAEALRLSSEDRAERTAHVRPLRDQVIGAILEAVPDSQLTGSLDRRMPNHASFAFRHVDGNLLLQLLDVDGFACSSGSACKTGNPEPSEVIKALGLPDDWALGSLRVTLGMHTTPEHVDRFVKALPSLVEKARRLRSG